MNMTRTHQWLLGVVILAALLLPGSAVWAGSRHCYRGGHGYHHSYFRGHVYGGYRNWGWGVSVPLGLSFNYVSPPAYRYETVRYVDRAPAPVPRPAAVVYRKEPSGPSPEDLMLERARQRPAGNDEAANRPAAAPNPERQSAELSFSDIKLLTSKGLGDQVIISQIRQAGTVFHLTTAEIIELKEAGVTEPVIEALIQTVNEETP